MLRARPSARILDARDLNAALDLCAQQPEDNVFVAARLQEGALDGSTTQVVGVEEDGKLVALCSAGANLVPVATTPRTRNAMLDRVSRTRRRTASLLGPAEQVLPLWELLEDQWGAARSVRSPQPHLASSVPPSTYGVSADPRVRPALPSEVDLVLPAAEHMFTAEIGYPPYRGSSRAYRAIIARLVEQRHTYVVVENDRVIFKADLGSVALGCAQIQGVWVQPELRGQGFGTAAMAAVLEQVLAGVAQTATLYVNHYNAPARATYERIGMQQIGSFATVLL